MVPSFVAHDRIDVGAQDKLASLARKTDLRVSLCHQLSRRVEPLHSEDYLGPGGDVQAGGQEVKAETEGDFAVPGFAEMGLALRVLIVAMLTSTSGVSSCHSGPMKTL